MINRDGGLVVTGYLTTTSENDTYPTHLDNLGKGGLHSASNLTERDAITPDRRTQGMMCFVGSELAVYQLATGITNADWVKIFDILGGGIIPNIFCPEYYILVGTRDGTLVPSPILQDIRLDLVNMRRADILLGSPNHKFPNGQALKNFQDGFVYNTAGKVSTYPRVPLEKLPPLNIISVGIGDLSYDIKQMYQGTNSGDPEASYDVALNLLNTLITFKTTPWLITKPGLIPPEIPISFPFAQYISLLSNNSVVTHTADGILGTVTLTPNQIIRQIGGFPVGSDALTLLEQQVTAIDTRLTTVEANVATLQGQVAALELTVVELQTQITAIAAAVAIIQGQIITIFGTLGDHESRITALEQAIQDINERIDNLVFPIVLVGDVIGEGDTNGEIETELTLTLDKIKKAVDTVDLNNQKIINLRCDDLTQGDALNSDVLWAFMNDELEEPIWE